ncbi:MAG: LPXTG cell wall anchor domain-containing protein, partial [Acidimicrobiia bacterium]
PDSGTLSVSPSTFAVNETATISGDNCPNGAVGINLAGVFFANHWTDGAGTWSEPLPGTAVGVGASQVNAVCFDIAGDVWTPRFVYSTAPITVTEVPVTTQPAPVTTVAAPVTTVADPTVTTAAPAGAAPTTAAPAVAAAAGATATTAAAAAAGPTVAAAVAAQSLPATGQGSERAAAVAVALLAIGAGALLLGRRKPADI